MLRRWSSISAQGRVCTLRVHSRLRSRRTGGTVAQLRKSRESRSPTRAQRQLLPVTTAATTSPPEPGSDEWLQSEQRANEMYQGERMVICAFVAFLVLSCGLFAITSRAVDSEGVAGLSKQRSVDQLAAREEALRRIDGTVETTESRNDGET